MSESPHKDNGESIRWQNPYADEPLDQQVFKAWQQSPLLAGIKASDAHKLVALTHLRNYRSGEFLFSEGETGVAAGLLIGGEVAIRSGDNVLVTLKPGDFFGEVALLEDAPRTASAVASQDARVSFLVRYQLEEFVRHRPRAGLDIMTNLARLLATRLHRLNSAVSSK